MAKQTKRQKAFTADRNAALPVEEALKVIKAHATAKFDETVGSITRSQLREIAEKKMKDLNANDIEAAARIIEGSARAMGLKVVEV